MVEGEIRNAVAAGFFNPREVEVNPLSGLPRELLLLGLLGRIGRGREVKKAGGSVDGCYPFEDKCVQGLAVG